MGAVQVLGVVATAVAAGGLANLVTRGNIDGRVKVMLDTYTIDASEIVASTITLGSTLPAGARVIAIILAASTAQTAATVSVGDDASGTRYVTASTGLQTAIVPLLVGGAGYTVGTATGDNQIVLTVGGATLTAGTLTAAILYVQD